MCAPSRLDDAVGVGLAKLLRPASRGVELAGRVALRPRRQLLQLDPEDPRALRRARGVDRHRLAADDRRLGRQQPALGLVDGARDAVEPRRHVHDRRTREPLVAAPARQLAQREVDLHLAAAVAEAPGGLAHVRPAPRPRRAATRRAASASHTRSRRAPPRRLAVRKPHAGGAPSDTRIRSTGASVRSSPPASRTIAASPSTSCTPPPFGTGIPPSWSAHAITCVMKPDIA